MSLSEENIQVLNLVQAMIGAVSPNLRRATVALSDSEKVKLTFVLELDKPIDREEIENITFEFEALQTKSTELEVEVVVDSRPFSDISVPGRVVYGRREDDL